MGLLTFQRLVAAIYSFNLTEQFHLSVVPDRYSTIANVDHDIAALAGRIIGWLGRKDVTTQKAFVKKVLPKRVSLLRIKALIYPLRHWVGAATGAETGAETGTGLNVPESIKSWTVDGLTSNCSP